MTNDLIRSNFPDQVDSGRPFIVGITTKDGNRYSLRICQQITPKADIELNGAKPNLKTGFHHGVPKAKVEKEGYAPGIILAEGFNLSVVHQFTPQYASQQPRKDAEGNNLTVNGMPYYEHVKLIYGLPKIELWTSDQYKERSSLENSFAADLTDDQKSSFYANSTTMEEVGLDTNFDDLPF